MQSSDECENVCLSYPIDTLLMLQLLVIHLFQELFTPLPRLLPHSSLVMAMVMLTVSSSSMSMDICSAASPVASPLTSLPPQIGMNTFKLVDDNIDKDLQPREM